MAEINWNLARIPDFVGNAYAARQQGIADRREQGIQNAYQQYARDPQAGINALQQYDPFRANQLQQSQNALQERATRQQVGSLYAAGDRAGARSAAASSGDFQLIQAIDAMDDRQRAEFERKAGLSVQEGFALRKIPAAQRPAYIQQNSPRYAQLGFSPQEIAAIPLDDATIDAGIARSQTIAQYLKGNTPNDPPSGYRWAPDGITQSYIRGGPADPEVIARQAGVRRDVIVRNPIPSRSHASGAGATGVPAGFSLD